MTGPSERQLSRLLRERIDQSFCPDAKSQKEKDAPTNTCLASEVNQDTPSIRKIHPQKAGRFTIQRERSGMANGPSQNPHHPAENPPRNRPKSEAGFRTKIRDAKTRISSPRKNRKPRISADEIRRLPRQI
jgi:hypothetical protein